MTIENLGDMGYTGIYYIPKNKTINSRSITNSYLNYYSQTILEVSC